MAGKVRLTDEELLQILRNKAAENDGRAPVRAEIPVEYRIMIKNRFGPWNNAIRKAGLVPFSGPKAEQQEDYLSPNQLAALMPKPYEEYTDSELLDIIKCKLKALGRPPKPKEIRPEERFFLTKRFGSLSDAYIAAGTSIGGRPVKQKKNKQA